MSQKTAEQIVSRPEEHTYHGPGTAAWAQLVSIPTYPVGKPSSYPMFLEKRVYQGSSGRVYPYPVIESVSDRKKPQEYQGLFLENKYVKVLILPQLGGRIQMALDKTREYHFVYYNQVIKPALVGLAGPWISGGIEFNWPQHHRPSTFGPVEWEVREHEDGSCTIWVTEIERMSRTRASTGFTLYPDRAYIEISGRVYNPQPLPATFLWWANPAVSVHEQYQSVFPPDVRAVFDHGKRDLSRFPVATGEYYKVDYSSGIDISWYNNIPVPTSYMAYHSEFDFVGGFDHRERAGILHVANHHISPGKKMWTWGTRDFGQAWERNLTDSNGPYIELMTGVFTDNQPDFTWLQPGEEKRFTQFFFPYKDVESVSVANERIVMGVRSNGVGITVQLYAPIEESYTLRASTADVLISERHLSMTPRRSEEVEIELPQGVDPATVNFEILDKEGRLVASYRESYVKSRPYPEKAQAAPDPVEVKSNEELYLWGVHLEQYRHATYRPEPYYREILRRDPGDSRANNSLGLRLLRAGSFEEAADHFEKAVERLTRRNPNPYNGEPFYNLGVARWYNEEQEAAYASFFKATWNYATKSAAHYYLARIDLRRGRLDSALRLVEAALAENGRFIDALGLRLLLLRKLGKREEAEGLKAELSQRWPSNYHAASESMFLLWESSGQRETGAWEELWNGVLQKKESTLLELVIWYGESGAFDEALTLCELYHDTEPAEESPLFGYFEALYAYRRGDTGRALSAVQKGEAVPGTYCFPNQLEAISALSTAMELIPTASRAPYYFGNLLFDAGSNERAHELWLRAVEHEPDSPRVRRNLALSYYNKRGEPEKARKELLRAQQLAPEDSRLLMELDVLYQKLRRNPQKRLEFLEEHQGILYERDDLTLTYAALHNRLGNYQRALEIINSHRFHPWEGGEGKVPYEYRRALIGLARTELERSQLKQAMAHLDEARDYPEHLGEGKLPNSADNEIDFLYGVALRLEGQEPEALLAFRSATEGEENPSLSMYYNDRPAEAIYYQGCAWRALGDEGKARGRFYKLRDYGSDHLSDSVTIDYFAVSLPDFLVFEENLNEKNRQFCHRLLGLGLLGLGEYQRAIAELRAALTTDPSDQISAVHVDIARRCRAGEDGPEQRTIRTPMGGR